MANTAKQVIGFIVGLGKLVILAVVLVVIVIEVIAGVISGAYTHDYTRSILLPLPIWGVVILGLVLVLRALCKRSKTGFFNLIVAVMMAILTGFYVYITFMRFAFPQITSTILIVYLVLPLLATLRAVRDPKGERVTRRSPRRVISDDDYV